MEPKQFIDDRNRSLWQAINRDFKLTVEDHPNVHFYHYFIDGEVYLVVPGFGGSIELFTHELLHLDLVRKGINVTKHLKDRFRNEPLLNWSLNENLFEQIGECLEHIKMLPIYLSMGFERDLFCETYYMPCCHEMNMQIIRSGMSREVPSAVSVDLFIHKFFAMKACLNPNFVYDAFLAQLEKINPELYEILLKFWNEWETLKIENLDPVKFKRFTSDFIHELGTWNIMNIYVKQKARA